MQEYYCEFVVTNDDIGAGWPYYARTIINRLFRDNRQTLETG